MYFFYKDVPYEATKVKDIHRINDISVIFCISKYNPNKFIIDKMNATFSPLITISDLLETWKNNKGEILKFTPKKPTPSPSTEQTKSDKTSPQVFHLVTIDHPNIYFVWPKVMTE